MVRNRLFTLAALCLAACGSDLVISPTALPNGAQGTPYQQALTSTGNPPVTWTVDAATLPPGIQLDEDSGILAGTPTASGTFSFTVQSKESATFHSNEGSETFSLLIQPLLVAEASIPEAQAGSTYTHVVTASGGVAPYHIQVKGLPGHFTFDATTATISGDPTLAEGPYTLEIDVDDSGTPHQTAVSKPTLVIRPVKVAISSPAMLADAQVNTPYSATLTTTNGAGPFTWSIVLGALPSGLDIDPSTGVISGTPSQTGTSLFTVQVADQGSPPDTATQEFTLTVQ